MVYDAMENAERYAGLHPLFPEAFACISAYLDSTPPPGKVHLVDDDLIAIVAAQHGGEVTFPRLEAHREYIDIQAALTGGFEVGWRPLHRCVRIVEPFDPEKDCMLFGDPPELTVPVGRGMFAVFFPEDAHAPAGPRHDLIKVVMKVRIG
jgi:YhcH/YjgK/YiaL family protein